MKKVTLNQLTDILLNMVAVEDMSIFANIVQFTDVKTTKKDRQTKEPFTGLVQKQSELQIVLNTNYKTFVENQLVKEGKSTNEYTPGKNTMPIDKSKSKNNFFGFYKDQPVLEYKPKNGSIPNVTYFLDGVEVQKTDLPDVLPKPSTNKSTITNVEIPWRKVYLKNIKSISIENEIYVVEN